MARLFAIIVAPFIGSLLGVLIARIPIGAPVVLARSRCDHCGHALSARDLIPLLSYAALRGRCRRCRARITAFHWQVELAALVVPVACILAGLDDGPLWAACVAGWLLLALAWIDAETMLLPDALTLPLALAGIAVTVWLTPTKLIDHALAAILAYILLREVGVLYRKLRHREGLGAGDAKLLGAIGAWVGLAALPTVLLGAALGGLGWALIMRMRGQTVGMGTALPFGPFLALAGWVVMLGA